tara:strand:+ start:1521 stop:4076 length:2556 start_codon:yes stop_codon:yes gene_type:complete
MPDLSKYWSIESANLYSELKSGPSGLAPEQAAQRLQQFGPNSLAATKSGSTAHLLWHQFESPLVLILIFAASVSLVVKEWTEAIVILMIVLGSTMLGFYQEYRASEAVKRLREQLALKVDVVRGGKTISIDAREVVPGDVISLAAGDLIPADGIILEARDFLVTQAALTGESFPVEKTATPSAANATLAERKNTVFLGTSVRSGSSSVLIVKTGKATEFGRIAEHLDDNELETDFAQGLRKFGYLLTRVMMVIVVFVLTANLLLDRPVIDSLLFAVALAVGLTPELLPAIVSVTLSAGARRMAAEGVLVRRLEAIENLGSADILCTDKTGTLTRGLVEINEAVDWEGAPSDATFRYAAANSLLETGIENPLDTAIVTEAKRRGVGFDQSLKIDEIPYDFVRKRLTIVIADVESRDPYLMISKGAFDTVIDCCSFVKTVAGVLPLDEKLQVKLRDFYSKKGQQGFRVLGLATRHVAAKAHFGRSDETGMTFEGFLLFFDPLKDGIDDTLKEFSKLGIAVKIISGDNRFVAGHVAEAVGLDATHILTGKQLNETRDDALRRLVERTDVFAEIDPQQKERIVLALKKGGHSVAYMGDGINDAPALHAADVGISVDQAVDVARESADIVLLKQDLNVLLNGIVDGRRTFTNTLKYISITTSANFGNMISMAIATLFVPFLPMLAKQILLNNFLSDIPSIALSTDNVDLQSTEAPQRWDIHNIKRFMIVFGLISTLFDLCTFTVLLEFFNADETIFQSTWFMVSLLTELAVVLVLRTHLPCWKSRPGKLLLVSTGMVAIAAFTLPFTGPVAGLFGFVVLPLNLLLAGIAILAAYIVATEWAKRRFYMVPGNRNNSN